ncbi:carbohydrate esterase family 8 protein [Parathielavia hyrcaniae]|uniref:pectinesterase n=1 Tax=Parathielavia hyrcaniae TaxID=113614 RepID=A0AAN6Q1E8_9PEZI|nr:carbohydrate esterase family 8 protein [Parathielavia hyrcaniae]
MRPSLAFVLPLATATAASPLEGRGKCTSPPAGCLAVGSSATYTTVQSAVDALNYTTTEAQCIFIYKGTYQEQIYIPQLQSALTLYGETRDTSRFSANTVTITQGKSQNDSPNNDATATLRAHTTNLRVYNINLVNTRGQGSQALALSAQKDRQGYYACQFKGYQDTILANVGAQVYARSYIEGATDFIFGQRARAWFDGVDIRVLAASTGWITANGRESDANPSYYVIHKSTVSARAGDAVAAGTYYLGRPWRSFSRVVFQHTKMSDVVNPAGWAIWNSGDERTGNVTYGEFKNSGKGARGTRADFSTKLGSAVSISEILGSDYKTWHRTPIILRKLSPLLQQPPHLAARHKRQKVLSHMHILPQALVHIDRRPRREPQQPRLQQRRVRDRRVRRAERRHEPARIPPLVILLDNLPDDIDVGAAVKHAPPAAPRVAVHDEQRHAHVAVEGAALLARVEDDSGGKGAGRGGPAAERAQRARRAVAVARHDHGARVEAAGPAGEVAALALVRVVALEGGGGVRVGVDGLEDGDGGFDLDLAEGELGLVELFDRQRLLVVGRLDCRDVEEEAGHVGGAGLPDDGAGTGAVAVLEHGDDVAPGGELAGVVGVVVPGRDGAVGEDDDGVPAGGSVTIGRHDMLFGFVGTLVFVLGCRHGVAAQGHVHNGRDGDAADNGVDGRCENLVCKPVADVCGSRIPLGSQGDGLRNPARGIVQREQDRLQLKGLLVGPLEPGRMYGAGGQHRSLDVDCADGIGARVLRQRMSKKRL